MNTINMSSMVNLNFTKMQRMNAIEEAKRLNEKYMLLIVTVKGTKTYVTGNNKAELIKFGEDNKKIGYIFKTKLIKVK
jgi:hydroxylamine reductase (hybrid-cluster protein)